MNFEVPLESTSITKYVYRPPDSTSIASTNITTECDTIQQSILIENGWNILQGKKITQVGG